jgi:large repetitive protein
MVQIKWFSGGVLWSAGLVMVAACGQANTESTDASDSSVEQPCQQKAKAEKKKAKPAGKKPRQHADVPKRGRHGRHHRGGHPGSPGGNDESTGGNGSASGGMNGGGMTGAGGRSGRGGSPATGGGTWVGTGGSWYESVCGDGWPDGYETCDDGNTDAADGCGEDCQLEPGWTCPEYGMPCHEVVCGDGQAEGYEVVTESGYIEYVYEECDDGNTDDGDGCTSQCTMEVGYYCEMPGSPCRNVSCGDGFADPYVVSVENNSTVWAYEFCDDGNTDSNDGCSADCIPEPNFSCVNPGEPCKAVVCGDGSQDSYVIEVVEYDSSGAAGAPAGTGGAYGTGGASAAGGDTIEVRYGWEQCDDGNSADADGCSAACEIEAGYVCTAPGQPCRQPGCGDGFQDYYFVPGSEGAAGAPGTGTGGFYGGRGGRSGYSGTGTPGTGGSGAGDGTWVWESCDDGNTADGDGCNASCQVEAGYLCSEPGQPCHQPVCGDGFQDGYYTPGSGGSAGAPGTGGSTSFGGSTGTAGNYVWEACDDGNTADADGCSASCQLEPGYVCTEPGQPCRQPVCGDGLQDEYFVPGPGSGAAGEPGTGGTPSYGGTPATGGTTGPDGSWVWEECDDGNTVDGDGCSSTCTFE